MADDLKQTFSVKVDDEEFVFRVPTPLEKAKLGLREAALRRELDPSSNGWPDGLDPDSFFLMRGMAVMELFLEKSTAKWAYSETEAGVSVDIKKFPAGKDGVITEVGRRFGPALDEFHSPRTEANTVPGETVAGS